MKIAHYGSIWEHKRLGFRKKKLLIEFYISNNNINISKEIKIIREIHILVPIEKGPKSCENCKKNKNIEEKDYKRTNFKCNKCNKILCDNCFYILHNNFYKFLKIFKINIILIKLGGVRVKLLFILIFNFINHDKIFKKFFICIIVLINLN